MGPMFGLQMVFLFFSFVSDSVVFIQETCLISSRMLKLFIENFLLFSWLVS
jgi:hypothetical protein